MSGVNNNNNDTDYNNNNNINNNNINKNTTTATTTTTTNNNNNINENINNSHLIFINNKTRSAATANAPIREWILCRGGCSGSGVQWIGVVLYSKIVYKIKSIHYTLFPLHPPLQNVERYIRRLLLILYY